MSSYAGSIQQYSLMNRKLNDQGKMSYFHMQKKNTTLVWNPPSASGGSLLHYDFHGLQRHRCLTMAFITDCKGISALAPRAPPHISFLVQFGVCIAAPLTYSHSSLHLQLQGVLSLSNCYPSNATSITAGLSLGQWYVCIGTGWHWFCQTWEKLLAASQKIHPCSPPITKTLPCKPSKMIEFIKVQNKTLTWQEKRVGKAFCQLLYVVFLNWNCHAM